MLQHQSTVLRAACPRTAAGCAIWGQLGAQSCGAEQGPCCAPGAVCRGRDSAACQAQHSACPGRCPGRCGETCGGKEPTWQGRGLLLPQLLPRAGGSQLHSTIGCFQSCAPLCKRREKAGIFLLYPEGKEKDWWLKSEGSCEM